MIEEGSISADESTFGGTMSARKPPEAEQWVDANGAIIRRDRRRAALHAEPGEKRRFERMVMNRGAVAIELDQFGTPGAPFDCLIQNISRGGLGLIAARMVHTERRLFIEVPGQPGAQGRLFFGVVRQCRYVEAQGYFVGIQFEPIPKTSSVEAWLMQRKRARVN